jgi:hypothetical protein
MKISDEQLDNWFTYHAPEEIASYTDVGTEVILTDFAQIRAQAHDFAETIRDCCPESADTTFAIRLIRMAVMTANQAIACGGK